MTADTIKAWFDGNFMLVGFVVGLIVKYVPFLAKIPNAIIPYLNVALYILTRLFVGEAHAEGVGSTFASVGILLGGFLHSVLARQLYEGFGRTLFEKWLGWKKA